MISFQYDFEFLKPDSRVGVVYLGGSVATQWEVGVKILKHLCVSVTKVQAHLLSTFSIELII